jgi:chemotaxis protein methyltransferase WspC
LSFRRRPRVEEPLAAPPPRQQPAPAAKPVASRTRATDVPAAALRDVAADAPPTDALAHARALADAGQLEAALAGCTRWLAQHPADSEGFYLLGLLESALGRHEAADQAFTRVHYLDRDHGDALAQRIGLAERAGRAAQARDLRARATRLRERQDKR